MPDINPWKLALASVLVAAAGIGLQQLTLPDMLGSEELQAGLRAGGGALLWFFGVLLGFAPLMVPERKFLATVVGITAALGNGYLLASVLRSIG